MPEVKFIPKRAPWYGFFGKDKLDSTKEGVRKVIYQNYRP